MGTPFWVATIAVWALVFGLFGYFIWRDSRNPPEEKKGKGKPESGNGKPEKPKGETPES